MSEHVLFNGRPVWVDVAADDPEVTRAFYQGLLGWEFEVSGPEYGNYSRARVDGRDVAGVFPRPEGVPIAWTPYFYSDDVDAYVAKAVALGGMAGGEPFDVPMVGRMGIVLDSNGAAFGLWYVDGMPPIDLEQERGAAWFENWSHDLPRATAFYSELFGYGQRPLEGMAYTVLSVDGIDFGATAAMDPEFADTPAQWNLYFSTPDVDAGCVYTLAQGGQVEREAEDTPFGRMAQLVDPFGARFKLMTPPPMPAS
jgi:predicted enzyme related to lactoylglutathione lyase